MDYKEQLKEALSDVNTPYVITAWIEEKFPELVESEDEIVRKEIISLVLKVMGREKDNLNDKNYDKMLDWLEKQKEKPIWTDNDRTMTFTLLRDVGQMTYISNEGKNERLEWLNSLEDRFNNVE